MAGSFKAQITTPAVSYIDQLAFYLEDRGLAVTDLPCIQSFAHDFGYARKTSDGQFVPFSAEGWAFQVKDQFGNIDEAAMLMRPIGLPDTIYQRQGTGDARKYVEVEVGKFLQVSPKGHEFLHWTSTMDQMVHSPIVMLHEKFTSATLVNKVTGVPCVALSGCWNWSRGRQPKPSIAKLIRNATEKATFVVCFDGDIGSNRNVMQAAGALKGWISQARPDITVIFPRIPLDDPSKTGWDDWTKDQGDRAKEAWLDVLGAEDVDVTSLIPCAWLMADYGVSLCERNKREEVEHTSENYLRLLRHPNWSSYRVDTLGGLIFNPEDVTDRYTIDSFTTEFIMWLEAHVFRGMNSSVKEGSVRRAIDKFMADKKRHASIPLVLLDRQPEVTEDEAREAALRAITEGLRVTGPMTEEHTIETLLRVSRDMVALWSDDPTVDVQWALALVGPTGCGKSNFPKSFLSAFSDWGYQPTVSQFMKTGARSSLEEILRVARDAMVGVYDEYDPDESSAKQVEQNLFTLSTTRLFKQRQMREEQGTDMIRHAAVMLTTTDKNRQYIRSGKDTGERRFITFEVCGVKPYGGIMSSDREVLKECGAVLLRYGYQLFKAGDRRSATEYSQATTSQYLGSAEILQRLGRFWARGDMQGALKKFMDEQWRKSNNGVDAARFSLPQLTDALLPGERVGRQDRADIMSFCESCGMVKVGKALVNVKGGSVLKDLAYEVTDPSQFVLNIMAKL